MKRYIRSSRGKATDIVDMVKIYENDEGDIYIYTRPNGGGRIDFPTYDEAKEYIRDHRSEIKCSSVYTAFRNSI